MDIGDTMDNIIKEPRQKRAIEKREKIIEIGFDLICKNGYHNINTAEIAAEAGVPTGILYLVQEEYLKY